MVVEFTTTCAIVAYHHLSCEFEPHSWRGVLDKTVCDKVCQWLATGMCISLSTPISATQLWELLYTYHVIKQCTEKETTSLSIFFIKLN